MPDQDEYDNGGPLPGAMPAENTSDEPETVAAPEETPPPAVDACPGCDGPVEYDEPDPGDRPTVWCPRCQRRYAIGV